jgi:hypothetical protein
VTHGFFLLAKFCQNPKCKTIKSKIKLFWEFSMARSDGGKKIKWQDFYLWFSICSKKYRRMVEFFYSIYKP